MASSSDVVVMPPPPAREEPVYVQRKQVKGIRPGSGKTTVSLDLKTGHTVSVQPRDASTRAEAIQEVASRLESGGGDGFKNFRMAVEAVENGKMMKSAMSAIDPDVADKLADVADGLDGPDAERFVEDVVEVAEERASEEG